MYETSGLEYTSRKTLWTLNDSGSEPVLYQIGVNGSIIRTLRISNTKNIDWEELAQDEEGNFYIGDFGNNSHKRENLRIIKISNPDFITSDNVKAEIIDFKYSDQVEFPPPSSEKNFDMEAMIVFGDSIFLFSKNWTNPFNGYTKLYRLPKSAGKYTAELIDSFYAGSGSKYRFWITAADISHDNKYLVLLSSDRLWIFYDFIGSDFFSGKFKMIKMSSNSQKEAICFISNYEIYITDERFRFFSGGKLYYLDLSQIIEHIGD